MPPLRSLLSPCLITLFKMMPPNDQLKASKMSPWCAALVRVANLKVKSLVITNRNVEYPCILKDLKDQINSYSLASKPAMQQLIDIPGEPSFSDYPMTTARLSKWHCLHIDLTEPIDTATIGQIANIFSAVTDLKCITYYLTRNRHYLAPLLLHPNWRSKLTNFMVDWIGNQQDFELITAINNFTALQYLALRWGGYTDILHLTILAQLKVVAFQSDNLHAFVRSLERYATDNADLQVHLISLDIDGLLSLSQPLHSRIVRFGGIDLLCFGDRVPLLCSQFRSLTSLSISNITVTEIVPLFTSFSQLHQLVHLALGVNLRSGVELPPEARSLAQLNTVKVLELCLTISSHSRVQWLNLAVTMPNLQSIFIKWFKCGSCGVEIGRYINRNSLLLNSSKTLNCLHSSLFALHSGVPLNRLILKLKEECISAEKLLLQSASEPSTE